MKNNRGPLRETLPSEKQLDTFPDPEEDAISFNRKNNYTAQVAQYFPPINERIHYSQYAMKLHPDVNRHKVQHGMAAMFNPEEKRRVGFGVELLRKIDLIQFVQNPYRDADLARLEAAIRRNHAIRSGISVREFFMFTEESELQITLPKSETHSLSEKEKLDVIDIIKEKTKDSKIDLAKVIKNIEKIDEQVKLEKNILPVAYWQALGFGRFCVIKIWEDETSTKLKRLQPINSRRMTDVILDTENDMSFEGVYVDGQPLDRRSMIYGPYQENQLSPHTEHYGYTPLETVMHLAEGLNIFWEEDAKEIQRSAWLGTIMLLINTAGLSKDQARARVSSIVKEIKPAKIVGIGGAGENGVKVEQIKLETDLKGIVELAEAQEAKIFKALQVPQFLVQSEDIANRATADKAAALFLHGVIGKDHRWLSDILEEQWYEPLLRQELDLEEGKPLPFRIRRVFKIPPVEDFVDLMDAIKKAVDTGIWDREKANEILKTPEVSERMKDVPLPTPNPERDNGSKLDELKEMISSVSAKLKK